MTDKQMGQGMWRQVGRSTPGCVRRLGDRQTKRQREDKGEKRGKKKVVGKKEQTEKRKKRKTVSKEINQKKEKDGEEREEKRK